MTPGVIVDADSCPREVRDILNRWADRGRCTVLFLAGRALSDIPAGRFDLIASHSVDEEIIARLTETDERHRSRTVVVTRDIPLAERCLPFGATVMNDRGDTFSPETIRERRSLRDRNAEIRAAGLEEISRGRTFSHKEVKRFSDALDRALTALRTE